jgi:hypothetical protein
MATPYLAIRGGMEHRRRSGFAIVFKSEAKDILKHGGP